MVSSTVALRQQPTQHSLELRSQCSIRVVKRAARPLLSAVPCHRAPLAVHTPSAAALSLPQQPQPAAVQEQPQQAAPQEQPVIIEAADSNANNIWQAQMVAMWRFVQHNPATARGAHLRRRATRPKPVQFLPPRPVTAAEAAASLSMSSSNDEDGAEGALVPGSTAGQAPWTAGLPVCAALSLRRSAKDNATGSHVVQGSQALSQQAVPLNREATASAAWTAHQQALAAFVAEHGHLPSSARDPAALCGWLCLQRASYAAWQRGEPSSMCKERVAALAAVPGFSFEG